MGPWSVYIHVPFCAKRCVYCDFFSTVTTPVPSDRYVEAVLAEWSRRRQGLGDEGPISVYVGGGTPSLFPARALSSLLGSFSVRGEVEATVEVNPGDPDQDWFARLLDAGVSRFSIGVQALDAGRLSWLGRRHTVEQAYRAIEWAKSSGAGSVSADIIYGTPGQTREALAAELGRLAATGVDHVSCYELTVADGSPLGRRVAANEFSMPSEYEMADLWQVAGHELESRGLLRYEVSNFARRGHECRHNEHYWTGGAYVGLGLGAHGFVSTDGGRWVRYANLGSLESYFSAIESGEPTEDIVGLGDRGSAETLSPGDLARERAMLGLRTTKGFDFEAAALALPEGERLRWKAAAERMIERGAAVLEGGRLVPTTAGLLLADGLAGELF